jgi:hypothetical protein
VSLLRVFVVFLLGIGATVGAYATGVADRLSHQFPTGDWFQPARPLAIRIADASSNSDCPPQYRVRNRSARSVVVSVAPTAVSNGGAGYYSGGEPAYGGAQSAPEWYRRTPYGYVAANPQPHTDVQPAKAPQLRIALAPGEQKMVGPGSNQAAFEPDANGAPVAERCDPGRVVTIELTDCATVGNGTCVVAANGPAPGL